MIMIPLIFSMHYLSFWLAPPSERAEVVTQKVARLQEIDFVKLKNEGVKLLIFDYDDTLAGQNEPLGAETIAFLKEHSEAAGTPEKSFHLVILSNRPTSIDQVRLVLDDTVLYFKIGSYRKPHPQAFLPILAEHNLGPESVAMIGDRGGTDMWGAYRLGFRERILVAPYSDATGKYRAGFFFRLIRSLENSRL